MSEGREQTEARARRWTRGAARRLPLHREEGQALLEFALVLLPLCLILFGAIEFGRAWNAKNDTIHLANVAARYAATNQLTSANCTKLRNEASGDGLQTPTITGPGSGGVSGGNPVTISVTVPFSSVVPLISTILNVSSLAGTATMQLEATLYSGTCY